MTDPRFSEDEVRRILTRAAAMQEEAGGPGDSRAMTLAEIEQVAAEAGIDRALVRRAATELPAVRRNPPPRRNPLVGAPMRIVEQREVPGTVDAGVHDRLLDLVQDVMGIAGQVTSTPTLFTWSAQLPNAAQRAVMIKVSSRDGRTRVRIEENLGMLVGGYFGGLLGGVGGGGMGFVVPVALALKIPALVPLLVGGWLAGVYGLTRRLVASKAERRAEELSRLADDLATICARAALAESSTPRALDAGDEA
ncbi:MAG: hypothetical protein D6705_05005 [Deltaproteobacteria bacterium]|nr:MAG: hypothetical protein D6705_05005 [Deltaproteobacteria bacterium]